MSRSGRPKWEYFNLKHLEDLAAKGLTMEQIAQSLQIARSTLFKYQSNDSDFSDAIKKGRVRAIAAISNALYEAALAGNVTAMIFFLKNRAPEQWNERYRTAQWALGANQPDEEP